MLFSELALIKLVCDKFLVKLLFVQMSVIELESIAKKVSEGR